MKRYYDKNKQRLVFIREHATPSFWDKHWSAPNLKAHIEQAGQEKFFTGITKRFLEPKESTRILEGGCGQGHIVYALAHAGYDAYGVDYAKQTVDRINQAIPELQIFPGDVTQLDFPDNYFDGYWSLGVIEHNFTGYDSIINEMQRVIRPGGYLFITFPHLSWLRKTKALLGAYPAPNNTDQEPNNFYQFAFNYHDVQRNLEQLGFIIKLHRPIDGLTGLRGEISILRPLLQTISRGTSFPLRHLKAAITELAAPVSGHIMLQVLQKKS
ncbi:MAG: class I SAM-dependent methyltransferase [bacterium]